MTRPPHDTDTPPVETSPSLTPEGGASSEAARAKAERAIRLAAALRANLRRRKAPARTPAAPKDSN
ncbi:MULTISPECIES: hypothetical protein [Brevundimonas]|jgi:hypothetical protein|uniref:hypothetical protein n=1 Tax=Brevundimonas TaxID=41275 RepID=UPI000C957A78|nr:MULTISPECIES: hypothetical protein [Brevundimonas]MBB1180329.1 hypothetical protein [Pseudomonas sp. FW305-3-2-15-E-TSA4]MEC7797530.1 hypothetical protein [Pseudomonadota bacterium]MAL57857.1 hypothetical protein [Brevundimonas sp.]MBJ7511046.1 hypothetical protein [Brevundimonas sp.]MCC4293121.1 hypothetical protein [Brevundimonas aurantiaca]